MTKNNKINYYKLFLDEKDKFDSLYYYYRKSPHALPSALKTLESYSENLEDAEAECRSSHRNYESNRQANYHLAEGYVEKVKHFLAIATVAELQKRTNQQ